MTNPEKTPGETEPNPPSDKNPPDLVASIGKGLAELAGSVERYWTTTEGHLEAMAAELEAAVAELGSINETSRKLADWIKGDDQAAHDAIEAVMKRIGEADPAPQPGRLAAVERVIAIMQMDDGDLSLSQLVWQGGLNRNELTTAICLGGNTTLRQLANQIDQLDSEQQALIRSVAIYRRLTWLLKILDDGPERGGDSDHGPGSGPDPGGPGTSPVGAHPVGPSPNSLTASLTIPIDYDHVDAISRQPTDKVDHPTR